MTYEERTKVNYDHPSALETELLVEHLKKLKERSRDINNIMEQYLTTVKPMHALYVEPTKTTADLIINSGMNDVAFDVMRTKIETLLKE